MSVEDYNEIEISKKHDNRNNRGPIQRKRNPAQQRFYTSSPNRAHNKSSAGGGGRNAALHNT